MFWRENKWLLKKDFKCWIKIEFENGFTQSGNDLKDRDGNKITTDNRRFLVIINLKIKLISNNLGC
jgi:hypothetical protein